MEIIGCVRGNYSSWWQKKRKKEILLDGLLII